jgi:beta-lactam-binding protein with PASTA domain
VGNISGDQSLRKIYQDSWRRYAEARHRIAQPILRAINAELGGGEFPKVEPKYMTGANAPSVPGAIIGASFEGAKAALAALGLNAVDGGEVDSDLPVGVVAASDPAPGSRVARGTAIVLYTSNGSQVGSEVPNVVGQTFEEAQATLNGAGFTNVREVCVPADQGQGGGDENGNGNGRNRDDEGEANVDSADFGRVVAQNPGGGETAKPDKNIDLGVLRESC